MSAFTSRISDDDFAHWAFGEQNWNDAKWGLLGNMGLITCWNKLHGNAMVLSGGGNITQDLECMEELYQEQKVNNVCKGQKDKEGYGDGVKEKSRVRSVKGVSPISAAVGMGHNKDRKIRGKHG